ncbi:hypothetical protein K461DRAFT_291752 [Myriangium duriaei CBS 260.36]|uniref:BTB domain-containing protein n=1 Tax=Myriangium duriaei CBS 260.36 TaxID=1168546 RepID=A0A9P4MJ10_9PEZI|nr:hypothetical protein K461DRAFT_291752 [Myriangium duriaei CBS 260.36]
MSENNSKLAPADADASKSAALSTLMSLLANSAYSDLTIICDSDTYHVHKAIMCSQSPWFQKACQPDGFMESNTNTIILSHCTGDSDSAAEGDDPAAVAAMITWCYGDGTRAAYEPFAANDPLYLAKQYVIADKYQIMAMQLDVGRRLERVITPTYLRTVSLYCDLLKYLYLNTLSTPSAVKNKMLDFALARRHTVFTSPLMQNLLKQLPDIALDIVRRLSNVGTWTLTPAADKDAKTEDGSKSNGVGGITGTELAPGIRQSIPSGPRSSTSGGELLPLFGPGGSVRRV